METYSQNNQSLASLLRELRSEAAVLLRQEAALARTEVSEKISRTGARLGRVATGGLVAFAGALVLLFGLSELLAFGLVRAGLDAGTAQWLAPAVVGLVVALIGWAMLASAKRALANENLVPKQTLNSLREDKEWAQQKFHNRHEPAA